MSDKQPVQSLTSNNKVRNARFAAGRYALDIGKTPRSEAGTTCSATVTSEGYCGVTTDDVVTDSDAMVAKASERPMYVVTQTSANNSDIPTIIWKGQSSVAPSSKNIVVEVYRADSTPGWDAVTLDASCNATAANTNCTATGSVLTNLSEYYEDDPNSSNYFIHFRVYQLENSTTETLRTNYLNVRLNVAPDLPTALVQRRVDDTVIATGGWTNEQTLEYTTSATDGNATDTLYLCIEKEPLGDVFEDVEDSCAAAGTAYSGSAVPLLHSIASQTDATQYHWQARVKDALGAFSAWVKYPESVNLESDRDYGIDTTPPTGGSISDGLGADVDFNNGSLTTLSANWTNASFDVNISGLAKYQYSIGTTVGGINTLGWTDCTPIPTCNTTPTFTETGLVLDTSKLYYVNVRAVDNAGNTQTAVATSDGIVVAPTLTFSVSSTSVIFAQLNNANGWTDSKTITLSTSTNAFNGYSVRAYNDMLLTGPASIGSPTIPAFSPGTYASPAAWGSNIGFGYTTNDTDITQFPFSGSCLGGGTAPCFAPFSLTGPGDVVMIRSSPIVAGESNILTYKVTVTNIQKAAAYQNSVLFTATPQY